MANRKDSKGRVLRTGETERKDGRYTYRYTGNDGKRKEVYAVNLNELRVKEKQILKDLELGISSTKMTLNECFERYMQTKTNVSEITKSRYLNIYELHVKNSWLGKKDIKDIKRSDILLFYKEQLKAYSPSTLRLISTLIFSPLEMATQDDILLKNPARGCSKAIGTYKPREAITEEEIEKYFDYAESLTTGQEYLKFVKFLLGTGLRIGEARALTWDDVDLRKGTVVVNKQLSYEKQSAGYVFFASPTKTESGNRTVPLSQVLICLLKAHKEANYFKNLNTNVEIDGYKGFVFCTQNGLPYGTSEVNRYFVRVEKRYRKEHNDTLAHLSCHLLRHTFCTRLARRGMSPHALQYIMGHSDYSTTANVYITKNEDDAREDFLRVMHQ